VEGDRAVRPRSSSAYDGRSRRPGRRRVAVGRAQPIDLQGGPVRIGLLSDLPGISAYLFRALSTAFVIAVIFWTVTAVRHRRSGFLTRAGIVIVMWAASIVTAAGIHTLDVWRYLVPAVPMVGITLSLFAVELAEKIACLRRANGTARELPCAER
jgi:hypothetical protein